MLKKNSILLMLNIAIVSQITAKDNVIAEKTTPEAIASRIENIRMGELIIKTQPGSNVRIQQIRHEFLFGTAIPNHLAENSEDPMTSEERKNFLSILEENFNYAVHENAMKWYDTEKQPGIVDYSVADRIWELMDSLNISMRGHCVYWAKDEFLMDWLKKLNNDELRMAVKNRAVSLISHFSERINEFDLNNEMIHGNFFRRRLGYGIISEMAWMVKAQNPEAILYVNDYGIVDAGYNAGPYVEQIARLLANGVPIDGIGIQAHRSLSGNIENTPYMVQKNLDRFSKFDLPIKITEALFVYNDDKTRAEELKKLFPVYFAYPKVEAIIIWGIWEKPHWIPHAAMWKTDFTPTEQARAYRDLVFNQWWTDTTVQADKNGVARTRAFYGDYIITVNGECRNISLSKAQGKTEVNLQP